MLFRIVLCLAILVTPALVVAQNEPNEQLSALLAEQLKPIQKQLSQLTGIAEQVQKNKDQAEQNQQAIKQLSEILRNTAAQIEEFDVRINGIETELRSDIARQEEILNAISTKDSTGLHIPRLSANMDQSADFKAEMVKAVHDSIHKQGTFKVVNRTSSYQRIYVNRKEYGVNARDTLTLEETPVGTVTTQLPGQRLENWTLGAPDYKEAIEIVPPSTPTTTVQRPLTPVYSSPVATTVVNLPAATTVYNPPVYYANPPTPTYYYWPYQIWR